MCSIIGSFSVDTFKELLILNKSRGSFSYSLTIIDPHTDNSTTHKDFGDFDLSLLEDTPAGSYLLGHCQAPTNGLHKIAGRIHPYIMEDGSKLLHNGIIKSKNISFINEQLDTNYEWDTQALAEYTIPALTTKLPDIEGSFACALINERSRLKIFRNMIAPLFINPQGDLSSTKFETSMSIKENTFYALSFREKCFIPIGNFVNTHNPYYF